MPLSNNFSLAQNSKLRIIEKIFEPLLDRLLDKDLAPNDISFLGLNKIIQGIDEIERGNKIIGLWHYTLGNLTDVLDGIRARRPNGKASIVKRKEFLKLKVKRYMQYSNDIPGQLVDGFCDRAREFYQIFYRNKKQLNNQTIEQSVLTATSCFLPSIARAKAESEGIIVKEKDEKGGSSIDRTKLLFLSLIYYILGNVKKSQEIDRKIYENNMATYQNRLSKVYTSQFMVHSLKINKINSAMNNELTNHQQTNAFERFLLYVQLLQEANKIIKNELKPYRNILRKYEKWQKNYIKVYLAIDINELREKYRFKTYNILTLYNLS